MQEVAQASGLSIGFISQVERDIAVPSLASLAAIARVLQVSPASLLPQADTDTADAPAPHRAKPTADRHANPISTHDLPDGPITNTFPGSLLSAEMRTDAPGAPRRSRHIDQELLMLVIVGALTVEVNGNMQVLSPGQSLHLPPGCHLADWNHTGMPTTVMHCTVAGDIPDDLGRMPL